MPENPRKFFVGIPRKNSKKILQENQKDFSAENQINFSEQRKSNKFFSGQGFVITFFMSFLNQFKFAGRDRRIKKGQSGVDKTRLKRMKRTPLQRWRYKLDKKKYAWPTPISNLPTYEQEIKIGYFKLQIESLLNYFFPHLRSRSRKNPPKTKR